MLADLVQSLAIGFALVVTRMAAFVFVSPWPGATATPTARVGLAITLGLAVGPIAPPASVGFGPALVLAALGDAATGATIGMVFRIGLSAADVLGTSLAQATGLTLASSYDPSAGTTVDPLSRLTTVIATSVALAVGAHRVVLGTLLASFRIAPPGAFVSVDGSASTMLAWTSTSIECGIRLAVPAIAVALAVQLAIGLATRAAPALQSFGVALPVTLASGLLVLLHGAGSTFAGLAAHLGSMTEVYGRALAP